MTTYVLSTMTAAVSYCFYDTSKADNPVMRDKVTIAGGASIPSSRSGFGEQTTGLDGTPIWVADGFVTPVSDAHWELLKEHPIFLKHQEKNLVKVINNDITGNHGLIRRHATGMADDGFRQMDSSRLKQRIKVSTDSMKSEQDYRL